MKGWILTIGIARIIAILIRALFIVHEAMITIAVQFNLLVHFIGKE